MNGEDISSIETELCTMLVLLQEIFIYENELKDYEYSQEQVEMEANLIKIF